MFAPTYFAPAYFAPGYFAASQAGYFFAPTYFAPSYFTDSYFAGRPESATSGGGGSSSLFGMPGCNCCSPPCCFSVEVRACDAAFRDVSITLTNDADASVALTGTSNATGAVVNGSGVVQRHCATVAETYTLTWSYAGAATRIAPTTTAYSFNPASCPGGDQVIRITFEAT